MVNTVTMWEAAWREYHINHPEVSASWGEQNGRWPNCTCIECDPGGLLPTPDIAVETDTQG